MFLIDILLGRKTMITRKLVDNIVTNELKLVSVTKILAVYERPVYIVGMTTTVYTEWNDKIVALEKMTWFHFHLMKTGFLFLLQTIY